MRVQGFRVRAGSWSVESHRICYMALGGFRFSLGFRVQGLSFALRVWGCAFRIRYIAHDGSGGFVGGKWRQA